MPECHQASLLSIIRIIPDIFKSKNRQFFRRTVFRCHAPKEAVSVRKHHEDAISWFGFTLFLSGAFCGVFSHLFQLCSVFPVPDSPRCHNPAVFFRIFV